MIIREVHGMWLSSLMETASPDTATSEVGIPNVFLAAVSVGGSSSEEENSALSTTPLFQLLFKMFSV